METAASTDLALRSSGERRDRGEFIGSTKGRFFLHSGVPLLVYLSRGSADVVHPVSGEGKANTTLRWGHCEVVATCVMTQLDRAVGLTNFVLGEQFAGEWLWAGRACHRNRVPSPD